MDNGVIKIKQEFSKIKADPEKYRKQADVSQTALKTLKIEADRLNTFIIELDSELNNQARKRKVPYYLNLKYFFLLNSFK